MYREYAHLVILKQFYSKGVRIHIFASIVFIPGALDTVKKVIHRTLQAFGPITDYCLLTRADVSLLWATFLTGGGVGSKKDFLGSEGLWW